MRHRDRRPKLPGAIDVIATLPVLRKVTFSVQGSVASGGGDGKTTNISDQIYPSSHDRHALADLAGRVVRDGIERKGSGR